MNDWLSFFYSIIPDFLKGLWISLQMTIVGLGIGFLLGLPSALGRVYGGKLARWVSIGYIELFRGTPLLVQLFIIYFGLPGLGLTFDRMTCAFIALGLNSGAYQAEFLRGAFQAIGNDQLMAGRALGMSRLQTIFYIMLPQALRLVVPAWSNEPISLLKSSAVAYLIAVPDLMTKAKIISAKTFDPMSTYLAVAVIYLIVVFIMTALLSLLEKATRIPGMGPEVEIRRA